MYLTSYVVCLISLLMLTSCAFCIIRITSREGRKMVIDTRSSFVVELLNNQTNFTEWQTNSKACTLISPSETRTSVNCKSPGTFKIIAVFLPVSGIPDEHRYISVKQESACYHWYVHRHKKTRLANQFPIFLRDNTNWELTIPEAFREEIHLWIFEMRPNNYAERKGTATRPSQYSKDLSRQFYIRGQEPEVEFVHYGFLGMKNSASLTSFNATTGTWHVEVVWMGYQSAKILVGGRAIALHDCFVRDTAALLSRPVAVQQHRPRTLIRSSKVVAFTDPCNGNYAVLLSRRHVFVTNDGFTTVKPLGRVPLRTLRRYVYISDGAFTYTYFILRFNADLFLMNRKTGTWHQIRGVIRDRLNGMKGQPWCHQGNLLHMTHETLILWTKLVIYINSQLPRDAFRQIAIPPELVQFTSTFIIADVSFDYVPNILNVVMKYGGNNLVLLLYDDRTRKWQVNSNFTTSFSTAMVNVQPLLHGQHSLLIVFKGGLLRYMGKTIMTLSPCYNGTINSPLMYGKGLLNTRGDYFVATEAYQVVYLMAGANCILVLPANVVTTAEYTLWLDPMGQLFMLAMLSNLFTSFKSTPYLLQQAITNQLAEVKDECPFLELKCDKHPGMVHLDKSEAWGVTCTLMFYRSVFNQSLQLHYDESDFISVLIRNSFDIAGDIVKETMMITVHQIWDLSRYANYTEAVLESTRLFGFEVKPQEVLPICKPPLNYVAYFNIGCPYGRHIRIRRKSDEDCSVLYKNNFTYFIDMLNIGERSKYNVLSDERSVKTEKQILVTYDYTRWGCPISVKSVGLQYVPDLLLYDGDTFVKEVGVNFVLWEEHDRSDFKYNTTMYDVLCWRKSQTWQKLLQSAPSGSRMFDLWGPANYIDCFSRSEGLAKKKTLSDQYEILNRTGASGVKFAEDYDAFYLIHVKIIDPDYSFCELHTKFAIATLGTIAAADTGILATSVITFIMLITLFLVTTYVYYRDTVYLKLD